VGAPPDPLQLAELHRRRHWIFDLDGTLTYPVHDFDAIRRELGVPDHTPILEHLTTLSSADAAPRLARLDAIESAACARAQPRPGAAVLLSALRSRGCRLGIVSRNRLASMQRTLAAAGLADHFDDVDLVGRDEAVPKPDPAGLVLLLTAWGAAPGDAVMVGDFVHDLDAGRAAGVATIYLDWEGSARWSAQADLTLGDLENLATAT
jgi:HAD superfamily hydrolase (TIGR01509 family)